MEASAKVTASASKGKEPQISSLLKTMLDTLLVPVLAVLTALIIGGIIIVVTDAAVYRAFNEGGIGAGLAAIWRSISVAITASARPGGGVNACTATPSSAAFRSWAPTSTI